MIYVVVVVIITREDWKMAIRSVNAAHDAVMGYCIISIHITGYCFYMVNLQRAVRGLNLCGVSDSGLP